MTALAVSEAAFQKQVVELAAILGWRHLHVRTSRGRRNGAAAFQTTTNLKGWPDLLLWHERKRRVVALELKSESGKLTDEQVEVLGSLAAAGIEAHCFRPSQLDDVHAVLW